MLNLAGRRLYLIAILLVGALLRLYLALHRPLQVDEGLSLRLGESPLGAALAYLRQHDAHPPLFTLFVHAMTSLHAPEWVLRSIMVLFGVISLALTYALVRLWSGDRAALMATGVGALMPSLIFYDSMIRMYAPFDTAVLASWLLLSMCVGERGQSGGWRPAALWAGWVACLTLAASLLYLGWIMVAAQLLYVAAWHRARLSKALALALCVFVLWLPNLPTFLAQLPEGGLSVPWAQSHRLAAIAVLPGQATLAAQTGGPFEAWLAVVAWIWGAAALVWMLRSAPQSALTWWGLPALLTVVYALVAQKTLFLDRYYLLFAYALAAWTGVASSDLLIRFPRVVSGAAAVAAAALFALAAQRALDPAYYTADWPAVGRLLKAESRPGDVYVLEQGSSFYVLSRDGSLDHRRYVAVLRPREVGQAAAAVSGLDRVWLVLFQYGPVDPDAELPKRLQARFKAARVAYFTRSLPWENVVVGLFVR